MRIKLLLARKENLAVLGMILVLMLTGAMYFFHIRQRTTSLHERNLRQLATTARKIQGRINGIVVSIITDATRNARGTGPLASLVRENEKPRISVIAIENDTSWLRMQLRDDLAVPSPELEISLNALLYSSLKSDIFEDMMLLESDGTIILRRADEWLTMGAIDTVYDEEGKIRNFSQVSNVSSPIISRAGLT